MESLVTNILAVFFSQFLALKYLLDFCYSKYVLNFLYYHMELIIQFYSFYISQIPELQTLIYLYFHLWMWNFSWDYIIKHCQVYLKSYKYKHFFINIALVSCSLRFLSHYDLSLSHQFLYHLLLDSYSLFPTGFSPGIRAPLPRNLSSSSFFMTNMHSLLNA